MPFPLSVSPFLLPFSHFSFLLSSYPSLNPVYSFFPSFLCHASLPFPSSFLFPVFLPSSLLIHDSVLSTLSFLPSSAIPLPYPYFFPPFLFMFSFPPLLLSLTQSRPVFLAFPLSSLFPFPPFLASFLWTPPRQYYHGDGRGEVKKEK